MTKRLNNTLYQYQKHREYQGAIGLRYSSTFRRTKLLHQMTSETLAYELALNEKEANEFILKHATLSKSLSLYNMLIIFMVHPNLRAHLVRKNEFKNFIPLINRKSSRFSPWSSFRTLTLNGVLKIDPKESMLNPAQIERVTQTLKPALREIFDLEIRSCKMQLQLASINSIHKDPVLLAKLKKAAMEDMLYKLFPERPKEESLSEFCLREISSLGRGNFLMPELIRGNILNRMCYFMSVLDHNDFLNSERGSEYILRHVAPFDASLSEEIYATETLSRMLEDYRWKELSFLHSTIAEKLIRETEENKELNYAPNEREKKMTLLAAPHPKLANAKFKYFVEEFDSLKKADPNYRMSSKEIIECMFILGLQQPWIAKEIHDTPEYYELLTEAMKTELGIVIELINTMKAICDDQIKLDQDNSEAEPVASTFDQFSKIRLT